MNTQRKKGFSKIIENQQGAALIAVLCILVLIAMLTASAVSISQLANHFSKIVSDRELSSYYAEGAGARMVWLLLHDKKAFPSRYLDRDEYDVDIERFMADGVKHKFKLYQSQVEGSIFDMASGVDISGSDPTSNLRRSQDSLEGEEKNYDDYLAFLDALKDYADLDDFVRVNGCEKNEYMDLGLEPLPRNRPLQFRDEVLLIPGTKEFFTPDKYGRLSSFQIIPLKLMQEIVGKESFFSASIDDIVKKCKFTREQALAVISGRQRWMESRTPLEETIEPAILTSLKSSFSFRESGFYSFVLKVSPEDGVGYRTLFFSLKLGSRISGKTINYYDWLIY